MKVVPMYPRTLRGRVAAATVALSLTCAGPAAAQAPIVDGYGGAGSVVSEVAGGSAAPSAVAPGAGSGDVVAQSAAPAGFADATPVGEATFGGQNPQAAASVSADDLPFTGLDLALIFAGGLVLLSVGVGARWLSSPRAPRTRIAPAARHASRLGWAGEHGGNRQQQDFHVQPR